MKRKARKKRHSKHVRHDVPVKRRRRATGRRRKSTAKIPRGIPVEGLVGAGEGGRYPNTAKSLDTFTTKSWRPAGNQDLDKQDVITFKMRIPPGQIIR